MLSLCLKAEDSVGKANQPFPAAVPQLLEDDVYMTGYFHERVAGATTFLIKRWGRLP
jgi:hypothetical protein